MGTATKTIMAKLDLQNAEFDALTRLAEQWKYLQGVAIVDDEYPRQRQFYEHTLQLFIEAYKANRGIKSMDSDPSEFKQGVTVRPVLQDWVINLTMMQQSVLISCIRSPDGLKKDHVAKLMLRWYRRCVLLTAFEKKVLDNPYELGGGSFTGPSIGSSHENWHPNMAGVVTRYLQHIDETPLHFHLHLMHATQILGYKHPVPYIRGFWASTYWRIVDDMHLKPETEQAMDKRLGDTFEGWDARNDPAARASAPKAEASWIGTDPTIQKEFDLPCKYCLGVNAHSNTCSRPRLNAPVKGYP